MKIYVNKDCMTKSGDFLKKGISTDIDENKEEKLFNLGLVEKFDSKKHTEKRDEVVELKAKLLEIEEERDELKRKVEALEPKQKTNIQNDKKEK